MVTSEKMQWYNSTKADNGSYIKKKKKATDTHTDLPLLGKYLNQVNKLKTVNNIVSSCTYSFVLIINGICIFLRA